MGIADKIMAGVESAGGGSALPTPWASMPISKFYPKIDLKTDRWDKLYPYRLLVIDTTKNNKLVKNSDLPEVRITTTDSLISFERMDNEKWIFTLPITPQQLSITDQYAINTSATLRGIVEEHGGARFKTINATGTMGVWPYKSSIIDPPGSPSIAGDALESVFGGAIAAAKNLKNSVVKAVNVIKTGGTVSKPITKKPDNSHDQGPTSTGFYQAQLLQQFLEQYVEAKKDPDNAGWRLVFDIPKQNQSYVVTPMQFVWQQNVSKPLEIQYQLAFKAWRRIDLKVVPTEDTTNVYKLSPDFMARILNTITALRKILGSIKSLVSAIRSDVATVFDILRQMTLFFKDIIGATITVVDLPVDLIVSSYASINESLKTLDTAGENMNKNLTKRWTQIGNEIKAIDAKYAKSTDPLIEMLKNPEANYDLFDRVPKSACIKTPGSSDIVDKEIEKARSLTIDDFRKFRALMADLASQLANSFGAGSAFFNSVYGKDAPTPRIQPMTLDEFDVLKAVYDVMQSLDSLTATTDIDDAKKKSNMDYVAGLADLAGIPFNTTSNKVLVPVPFGLTVEAIAARYLGDHQRWIEIVTLNNLREPYIDESGFKLTLLSNASGRQITVNSSDNLYIGQRAVLKSSTQPATARRILGIDQLSETSFLLTMDGESNLDTFITADLAYLHAYLPGTVNSQQKIFIPSNLPLPATSNIVQPASVTNDPLTGLSKVDWLLTDSGDIAVNSFGDFRFSSGMTNIIQGLKIKLGTSVGTFIIHPEFGLGVKPGVLSSEVDLQEIYASINGMIKNDPRYDGIDKLQMVLDGPKMAITIGVVIRGQTGVFPVTFELTA